MATTESISGLELIVCACGVQEYTAKDAIDAAMFRGELDDKWKKFLHDVAAEDHADQLDLDVDESAVSAAAEAFRYKHDLITAEETEAWLTNRGLTFDNFSDYFTRRYYADTVREEVVPDEVEYHSASPDLQQLFAADLIMSGEMERMIKDLMWRLAARCAETDLTPEAIAAQERTFWGQHKVKQVQLASWLKKVGRDSKWFNEMLVLEAAYGKRRDTLLVAHARQRELATLRLQLTRVEIEVIELESRDAAREALFCVHEDGMSMEEVAAESRYPYRRADFLLEDIPIDSQQKLLSVSAGDILEPTARGDGFELCRVINKIEPRADDPAVQSRIDQRLLERHFSELTNRYTEHRLGGVSNPAE